MTASALFVLNLFCMYEKPENVTEEARQLRRVFKEEFCRLWDKDEDLIKFADSTIDEESPSPFSEPWEDSENNENYYLPNIEESDNEETRIEKTREAARNYFAYKAPRMFDFFADTYTDTFYDYCWDIDGENDRMSDTPWGAPWLWAKDEEWQRRAGESFDEMVRRWYETNRAEIEENVKAEQEAEEADD